MPPESRALSAAKLSWEEALEKIIQTTRSAAVLVAGDPVVGEDLASQPTLSRFENTPDRKELLRMTEALADRVLERHRKRLHGRARRITIVMNPTDAPGFKVCSTIRHFSPTGHRRLCVFLPTTARSEVSIYPPSGHLRKCPQRAIFHTNPHFVLSVADSTEEAVSGVKFHRNLLMTLVRIRDLIATASEFTVMRASLVGMRHIDLGLPVRVDYILCPKNEQGQ